jgi:hypothetical protein
MQLVDAVRALAIVITKDDLIVSASGYLRHDWWNHRPAGSTPSHPGRWVRCRPRRYDSPSLCLAVE